MADASRTNAPWSYARSGVDRSRVSSGLAALLAEVSYRPPPSSGRVIDAPGHYSGLIRIGRETIAVTTDTVGTKVKLAAALGRWEEVGEDIVGVNVNDLASVGARPAGLVDTILCRTPDEEAFRGIGKGLDRGLRRARCALLGGETAVVPEIVDGIDLGATAFGFFPRGRRPVLGASIRPGDRLIGVPSSGVHANGLTLVRRLLKERSVDLLRPRPGGPRPIGEEILTPTRIYSPVGDALADLPATHGLAHLSGGGVRNLVRLHPKARFVLDRWPEVPGLFRWIQQLGGLSDEEMFQTFNMGIGFVLVVANSRLAETRRRLARADAADAVEIGHVERGTGVTVPPYGLSFEGYS
jgi:phosphoribosylformylglycinamidine cyclo-ligase